MPCIFNHLDNSWAERPVDLVVSPSNMIERDTTLTSVPELI